MYLVPGALPQAAHENRAAGAKQMHVRRALTARAGNGSSSPLIDVNHIGAADKMSVYWIAASIPDCRLLPCLQ